MSTTTVLRLEALDTRAVIDTGFTDVKRPRIRFGLVSVAVGRVERVLQEHRAAALAVLEDGNGLLVVFAADQVGVKTRLFGADPSSAVCIGELGHLEDLPG